MHLEITIVLQEIGNITNLWNLNKYVKFYKNKRNQPAKMYI